MANEAKVKVKDAGKVEEPPVQQDAEANKPEVKEPEFEVPPLANRDDVTDIGLAVVFKDAGRGEAGLRAVYNLNR